MKYTDILNAIKRFVDVDMLSKATGNQRIILRGASVALAMNPDLIWSKIADNPIMQILNIVDGNDIDIDNLENILVKVLDDNEFELGFELFGSEYKFYIDADDIHKIKSYCGR